MDKKYQYHIYNQYVSFIVTTESNSEEYVKKLAKSSAKDYYGLKKQYLRDLKIDYICDFYFESIVNVNSLNRE